MPRQLTPTAVRSLLAENAEEVFLLTVRIFGSGISDILLVHNLEDIQIGGKTYTAFPFNIVLPNESRDKPPLAQIRIDNLEPEIIQAIRTIEGRPNFELAIRLASAPNIIEVGPITLKSSAADWDDNWVELSLVSKNLLNEPWPSRNFSPTKFPGLFQ